MGNERGAYTVDEAMESMGFGKFQVLVLLYAGIGYSSEAMELMILSFIGSPIRSEWNLSPQQESLISSVVFAGMLLGQISWGFISDNYGRRKCFFFSILVTSVAGFLSAFSPNYITLVILRCFVGYGLGGEPVLLAWFLELVPATSRGIWMTIFSFFWSLGTILEVTIAWVVIPNLGWRWLLVLSTIPVLPLIMFYSFTLESPRYLCSKGRTFEAMKILENMARMNNKLLPSGSLISDAIEGISGDVSDGKAKFGFFSTICNLFSPKLLRSTILLWISFFGNIFAYYGIVLITSALSNENMACSSPKLRVSSSADVTLYKDVFINSFAELPGLVLLALMIDRLGRKLSMEVMLCFAFMFLVPLAFPQNESLTIALLFCTRLCITASSTGLCIYTPEIYPTSLRSCGFGTANAIGKIGGIISPLVAIALVDNCHQTVAIILFETMIGLSIIATALFQRETKGRNLDDTLESLIN